MNRTAKVALISVVSLLLACEAASAADTGAATPNSSADSGALQEVTVIATRRETNLQSTPISVSALGTGFIAQTQSDKVSDLAVYVPNFSASTAGNFNVASFAIRGVADNQVILYTQPPVGVLIDDFVIPRVETQLLDTFDLQQVEVLRGPQGTLFGKNTTGGAVVLRTKRPVLNEWGAEATAEVGQFATKIIHGALNAPIGETLAARAVVSYEKSDGYYRDGACFGPIISPVPSKFGGASGCGDGRPLGGSDIVNGRLKLLWEPNANFDALLQYEFIRDRSDAITGVDISGPDLLASQLNVGPSTHPDSDPLHNAGTTLRNDVFLNGMKNIDDANGIYLNMDYTIDAGTFTSVTGYRRTHALLPSSYSDQTSQAADGEYLSFFDATREDRRDVFQQELRFASKFAGPVNFVGGAFFQKDNVDFCITEVLGFLDLTQGPLPFGTWNNSPYLVCNAQKAKSVAAYAEGTYKATERLSFTAGARFTWDDKTFWGRQQVFIPQLNGGFDPSITLNKPLDASVFNYTSGVISIKDKTSKPTWRFGTSYQATPDIFLFGTYARGFKSGGFNDQIGTFHPFVNADGSDNLEAFRQASQPPNPETADSFEIGVKSEWLDRRLRANVTGYYVLYSDLQRQMLVPLVVGGTSFQVTRYFNAAKADVKGIEAELTYQPIDSLTLRTVVGTADGKYKEYNAPIPAGYDLTLAPLDRTPKVTASAGALYQVPIGSFKLAFDADVSYVARNLFAQSIVSLTDNSYLEAHTLVDANVTLSAPGDRYFIRAIGKNLADKRYMTTHLLVVGLWDNAQYGRPRYFAVEGGVKF